jgi:heptose I phosphotransferase
MTDIFVHKDLEGWAQGDAFAKAKIQTGKIFRSREGRRTLRFEHAGRSYFLKYHGGVGWAEIFKNLLQLRLPVLGAWNEYEAANKLSALAIDTLKPVAFGERGNNPATKESFLITEDLVDTTSLEDYCRDWQTHKPSAKIKRALINKVAHAAKIMHENGINHRDFYICHFLLENGAAEKIKNGQAFNCYLIDLHRSQIRKRVPVRWREKDLGGLLYSTLAIGLSLRDYLRFVRTYSGKAVKQALAEYNWADVVRAAEKLYQKDFGKLPALRLLEKTI